MGEEKRKPGRPRKKPLEETPGVTSEAKASLTMSQKTGEFNWIISRSAGTDLQK